MTVPAEAEAHHPATAGALCRARLSWVGSVGRVGRSGSERVGAEHIIVEQTSSKFRKVHKIQPTTNAFFCCSGSVRSGSVGQVGVGSERLRQPTTTTLPPSLQPYGRAEATKGTLPSGTWSDDRPVGFPFSPKTKKGMAGRQASAKPSSRATVGADAHIQPPPLYSNTNTATSTTLETQNRNLPPKKQRPPSRLTTSLPKTHQTLSPNRTLFGLTRLSIASTAT